jgi:hypothetical protein
VPSTPDSRPRPTATSWQRRHSGCRRRQRCDPHRPVDGKTDHALLRRHVRQAAGDHRREIARNHRYHRLPSLDPPGCPQFAAALWANVDAAPKGLGRRERAFHWNSQPRLLLQRHPTP